jgi:adenosylcobinamide amidohydrolase
MKRHGGFTTKFVVRRNTLLIDLGTAQRILSSSPRHGGMVRARYIVNHQVESNSGCLSNSGRPKRWGEPGRYLSRVAAGLGVTLPCVALMTAVSLDDLVVLREEDADLWLEGLMTVGVSNAVRAGEPVEEQTRVPSSSLGTINIILRTNARLSSAAMVGMVQVVAESKAAALFSQSVRSITGRQGATGTGTDATVIVSGDGPRLRYSGTHTKMGEMVGRLVYRGVLEGLKRYQAWDASSRGRTPQRLAGRSR